MEEHHRRQGRRFARVGPMQAYSVDLDEMMSYWMVHGSGPLWPFQHIPFQLALEIGENMERLLLLSFSNEGNVHHVKARHRLDRSQRSAHLARPPRGLR